MSKTHFSIAHIYNYNIDTILVECERNMKVTLKIDNNPSVGWKKNRDVSKNNVFK